LAERMVANLVDNAPAQRPRRSRRGHHRHRARPRRTNGGQYGPGCPPRRGRPPLPALPTAKWPTPPLHRWPRPRALDRPCHRRRARRPDHRRGPTRWRPHRHRCVPPCTSATAELCGRGYLRN
jgi:hypothetical protein